MLNAAIDEDDVLILGLEVHKGAALTEVLGVGGEDIRVHSLLLRDNRLNIPNIDDEAIWILAKVRCVEDLAIRSYLTFRYSTNGKSKSMGTFHTAANVNPLYEREVRM